MGMIFRVPAVCVNCVDCAAEFPREHGGAPASLGHPPKSGFPVHGLFPRKDLFVVGPALLAHGFCVDRRESSRNQHEYHDVFPPSDSYAPSWKMSWGSSLRCLHAASAPIEDVLWDNGIHRTTPENQSCLPVLDAISLGDILRIAFASPAWGFAPIRDVLLENGFPLTKRRSRTTSENRLCRPDPDSCGTL